MLGLSLWEGRLPGRKAIENEDKGSHCSYKWGCRLVGDHGALRARWKAGMWNSLAAGTLTSQSRGRDQQR